MPKSDKPEAIETFSEELQALCAKHFDNDPEFAMSLVAHIGEPHGWVIVSTFTDNTKAETFLLAGYHSVTGSPVLVLPNPEELAELGEQASEIFSDVMHTGIESERG